MRACRFIYIRIWPNEERFWKMLQTSENQFILCLFGIVSKKTFLMTYTAFENNKIGEVKCEWWQWRGVMSPIKQYVHCKCARARHTTVLFFLFCSLQLSHTSNVSSSSARERARVNKLCLWDMCCTIVSAYYESYFILSSMSCLNIYWDDEHVLFSCHDSNGDKTFTPRRKDEKRRKKITFTFITTYDLCLLLQPSSSQDDDVMYHSRYITLYI